MLILNPREVMFGSARLANIAAVVIDREAASTIEEFGEHGPYAALVDVPRQRVRVRLVQEGAGDGGPAPGPGAQAVLSFTTAPAGGARSRRLETTAVVLSVEHEISLRRGSIRTITLGAVSSDGATDPIIISALEGA